jgi:hypothetical protein
MELITMKKVVCLILTLMLMMSMALTASAAEGSFVPSITYKPEPEIVPVVDENGNEAIGVIRDASGEVVGYLEAKCLLVTPIAHVWDEDIEVPEDVERLLIFVYTELNDSESEMEIPYDKHGENLDPANMVIRDLFDARWGCEEHPPMVAPEGVVLELTFDLGIMPDVPVYVMTYDEQTKEWSPIVRTVNNGDGTVTCTFEHLCAIEFSVPLVAAPAPADEAPATNLMPFVIALVAAAAAAVAILIVKNKKKTAA